MRRTGGTNGARTFRGADSALVAPRSSWTAFATLSPPARPRSPTALCPSDSAASLASTRLDLLKSAAMSTSHGRIRAISLPCPTFIPVSTKVASILACAAMTASYVAWAVALWKGFYRASTPRSSSLAARSYTDALSNPRAQSSPRSRLRLAAPSTTSSSSWRATRPSPPGSPSPPRVCASAGSSSRSGHSLRRPSGSRG